MQRLGEERWPKFNRTQAKEREQRERINSSQEKIKNKSGYDFQVVEYMYFLVFIYKF